MLKKNSSLKNETPYKGKYDITQCWTNGEFKLQYGAIKFR